MEQDKENLLGEVEGLTAERNELRVLLDRQEQATVKYQDDIKREQAAAELARIETAKSRVELEQLRTLVTDLNEQLKTSIAALENAKSEAITATKQAAVAAAQTEAERARANDLSQRLANTEKHAETALKEAREASEAAATYRGQLHVMKDHLHQLQAKEAKKQG